MEPLGATELPSINYSEKSMQNGIEELESLVMATENSNSFTALLELPPNRAVELLHSGDSRGGVFNHALDCAFPSNVPSINHAVKYSVSGNEDSPEPSNSSAGLAVNVKLEPVDSGSNPNSSDPMVRSVIEKTLKRKEREKKGKSSSKKSKAVASQCSDDGEKLPYVHVRARRGQATDSHSLAERARREKINARMKLLQELVPGCNKISGTALVLDEIINHVQSLQRQVEYLSMRLAAVNPTIDVNLDSLISAGTEPMVECNLSCTTVPQVWSEIHGNGDRQQFHQQWHFNSWNQPMLVKEANHRELADNSLLCYDSLRNSGLQSSQLKMEL